MQVNRLNPRFWNSILNNGYILIMNYFNSLKQIHKENHTSWKLFSNRVKMWRRDSNEGHFGFIYCRLNDNVCKCVSELRLLDFVHNGLLDEELTAKAKMSCVWVQPRYFFTQLGKISVCLISLSISLIQLKQFTVITHQLFNMEFHHLRFNLFSCIIYLQTGC